MSRGLAAIAGLAAVDVGVQFRVLPELLGVGDSVVLPAVLVLGSRYLVDVGSIAWALDWAVLSALVVYFLPALVPDQLREWGATPWVRLGVAAGAVSIGMFLQQAVIDLTDGLSTPFPVAPSLTGGLAVLAAAVGVAVVGAVVGSLGPPVAPPVAPPRRSLADLSGFGPFGVASRATRAAGVTVTLGLVVMNGALLTPLPDVLAGLSAVYAALAPGEGGSDPIERLSVAAVTVWGPVIFAAGALYLLLALTYLTMLTVSGAGARPLVSLLTAGATPAVLGTLLVVVPTIHVLKYAERTVRSMAATLQYESRRRDEGGFAFPERDDVGTPGGDGDAGDGTESRLAFGADADSDSDSDPDGSDGRGVGSGSRSQTDRRPGPAGSGPSSSGPDRGGPGLVGRVLPGGRLRGLFALGGAGRPPGLLAPAGAALGFGRFLFEQSPGESFPATVDPWVWAVAVALAAVALWTAYARSPLRVGLSDPSAAVVGAAVMTTLETDVSTPGGGLVGSLLAGVPVGAGTVFEPIFGFCAVLFAISMPYVPVAAATHDGDDPVGTLLTTWSVVGLVWMVGLAVLYVLVGAPTTVEGLQSVSSPGAIVLLPGLPMLLALGGGLLVTAPLVLSGAIVPEVRWVDR